ncbi:MAG: TPM domain-containing protein [Cyanobacteria bacterium P01_H01_bin.121]
MSFIQPAYATGVYDLPIVRAGEPTWVVDDADLISRFNENNVGKDLSDLAAETGTEVRFVIIRRLDYGETIDSLLADLFQTWYPDAETQANQVLVGLDSLTNTTAIQVGETAQAVLDPETATSVIDETMQAPLVNGDRYNQCLLDTTERLVAVLSGLPDPGPPIVQDAINADSTFASAEETQDSNATTIVIVLLIAATIIPMLTYFVYVR